MGRPHPIRDAGLAITLLTAVPLAVSPPDAEGTDAAGWFPAVGLVLGGIVWGALHLLLRMGWTGSGYLVVGALIMAFWAAATRMLHWDGLADVGDAYWGGHTPERRLEIMADSHVGAFGVATLVLVGLLDFAAISTVAANHQLPFLVIPVFARLAATFAAWFGRPARPGGLGSSAMGRPRVAAIVPATLVVGPVLVVLWMVERHQVWWLGLLCILVALAVPHLLSKRFGGVTGDVMGASVLVTEALLFVAFAVLF